MPSVHADGAPTNAKDINTHFVSRLYATLRNTALAPGCGSCVALPPALALGRLHNPSLTFPGRLVLCRVNVAVFIEHDTVGPEQAAFLRLLFLSVGFTTR